MPRKKAEPKPEIPEEIESVSGVLADPQLRQHLNERFTHLIDLWFDETEERYRTGDASERAAITKMLFPLLVKTHKDSDELGETADEINQKTREMFREAGLNLGD